MPNKEDQGGVIGLVEAKFDFGLGREVKLRFEGHLEINLGTGIVVSDILIERGSSIDDVRLRIRRLPNGFEVSMHGMLKGEEWGRSHNAPRLRLTFDQSTKVASTYLVTGSRVNRQERLVDQMNMTS